MLIVSIYSRASDTAIRGLAELSDLLLEPCASSTLDISLLDMLGLRTLTHSISIRRMAITLSQLLAILCGLMPAIASVLLTTENVPSLTELSRVEEESWFGTREIREENLDQMASNREGIGSLGLSRGLSNFTSPRNTYQDLLFPQLKINDSSWGPEVSAEVEMPAVKLMPKCTQLSRDDYQVYKSFLGSQIYADVKRQIECPDGTPQNLSLASLSYLVYDQSSFHFGRSTSLPTMQDAMCKPTASYLGKAMPPWAVQMYTWGKYPPENEDFDHLSVWKCNFTWMDVPTNVSLLSSRGDIIIDHNLPPVSDDSAGRPWTPPFGVPLLSGYLLRNASFPSAFASVEAGALSRESLSDEFPQIVEPYGKMKIEDLGRPDKHDQILAALQSTVSFTAAQLANLEQRLGLNETSDSAPTNAPARDSQRPITGIITNSLRQRLVRSPNVSYALISILSVVAVVHIWALISEVWRKFLEPHGRRRPWLLDLNRRGVAASDFGSLNMMPSLLDGSKCVDSLPEDAHLLPAETLHRYLAEKTFRLGWFHNIETDEDIYTIRVLDQGNLVFKCDAH